MIFRFGRKKFSDVIKVVQFLDKETIEYEVMADIEIAVAGGSPDASTPTRQTVPAPVASVENAGPRGGITPIKSDNDPAWQPAAHTVASGESCGGKGVCKHGTHYGMIV